MKPPRPVRISLDQIRIAKRAAKSSRFWNPCESQFDDLVSATEATNGNMQKMWPFILAVEKCIGQHEIEKKKETKSTTLFYLSQFLVRDKLKRK